MKLVLSAFILLLAVVLLSWGQLGHRTVGIIAERHLSAKAKEGIRSLLGTSSLADVANWADDVRGSAEYRNTGKWHYINLPAGLHKAEFTKAVIEMSQPSVYQALINQERQLANPSNSREEKITALKFIVHFVGDLHQPMHVSRAEDQGGNKVQVNYEGRGTNLHSLWDSRLLEHEGLSDDQLATKVDKADPKQVVQWQKEPLIDWLWESYQFSSVLYKEVEALSKRTITDEYYNSHISIAEERLEKAGIRLAGVLNQIFAGGSVDAVVIPPQLTASPGKPTPSKLGTAKTVEIRDIGKHIGEEVKVCDKVFGEKVFSTMTLVNMGAAYPNQLLTVVLKGEARGSWKGKTGVSICVKGKVVEYRGKPEIQVSKSENVMVLEN